MLHSVAESALLLVRTDMQKELGDDDPTVLQQSLERPYVLHPQVELVGSDLAVDLRQDQLLVIGPVEDDHLATGRRLHVRAPDEVMLLLLLAHRQEVFDADPFWVGEDEHILDGDVLAGRIHTLEDDQQPAHLRGEHQVLELPKLTGQGVKLGFGPLAGEATSIRRVDVIQTDVATSINNNGVGHVVPPWNGPGRRGRS